MLKPAHSWTLIRAALAGSGVKVFALSPEAKVAELQEEVDQLLAESGEITDLAKKEDRDLTDDEESRLAEMYGEDGKSGRFAEVVAELKKWQGRAEQRRTMALAGTALGSSVQTTGTPTPTSAVPQIQLRDVSTGQPIRAVSAREPLFTRDHGGVDAPNPFGAIHAMATGRSAGIQGAVTSFDSGGSFLFTEQSTAIMLDRLRPSLVMGRIGAQFFDMTSETATVATIESDPTASWVPEKGVIPGSAMGFGQRTLTARKLTCLLTLTEEFIMNAVNGAALAEQTAINSMNLAWDQACLWGRGDGVEPLGIMNYGSINTVDTVGFPTDYKHLSNAVGKIYENNYPGEPSELSVIMPPRDATVLDQMTDLEGRTLEPTKWVGALKKFTTTSMRTNLGAGSDESEALVIHGPSVLIGIRRQLEGQLLNSGTARDEYGVEINAVTQHCKFLRLTMFADVALLRPTWATAVTGILAEE